MSSTILKLTRDAGAFSVGFGLLLSALNAGAQDRDLAWMDMDRSMLQVAVDLASDTAALSSTDRQQLLDALYAQLEAADAERVIANELIAAAAEEAFRALVASEGERPIDYLIAARRSYARLKSAEQVGERDWISRHFTAAKKYVALAAEALARQAIENENSATKLQAERYAVRQPPDEATKVLEQLKQSGLAEEHRKLLGESGLTPEEISAYQQLLQATPAAEVGSSVVELFRKIGEARRQLAASLEKFTKEHQWVTGDLGKSFVVGNPRDTDAVINLVVRRVAMPPEWTVSLVEDEPKGQKPANRLREVQAGSHYQVSLPGRGQIRIASVIVPGGVIAEHTTARWAVEGRIGEELLGGILQEVNVPAFLSDLQLPGIAPAAQAQAGAPAAQPEAARDARRNNLVLVIAAALLLAIAVAVAVWRARKRT